jgi:hypothetical protein
MTLAIDYFGHEYEDSLPAFVEVDAKHLLHRPTSRFLDKVDLLAQWQEEGYTPGAKEVGPAADWLWNHYVIGTPPGSQPSIPPEVTFTGVGTGTLVITIADTIYPAGSLFISCGLLDKNGSDGIVFDKEIQIANGTTASAIADLIVQEFTKNSGPDVGTVSTLAPVSMTATKASLVVTVTTDKPSDFNNFSSTKPVEYYPTAQP